MKITIDNDDIYATFIISTLSPEMDDLNDQLKASGCPDHVVYAPTILETIHEILAKVASDNGQTFDETVDFMKAVEKEYPAMGHNNHVSIDYKYFGREKK